MYKKCVSSFISQVQLFDSRVRVLIGGDLNGQFKQGALCETGNMKSKLLTDFIIINNMLSLQSVYDKHNKYTNKNKRSVGLFSSRWAVSYLRLYV